MSETQADQMTIDQARAFIAAVPWRWVKDVPVGEGLPDGGVERWGEYRQVKPDRHQYVIRDWREVDDDDFERFVAMIRRDGYRATYRAPYRPDHEMKNSYLEIDGWCYWFIGPRMLNRERAVERKHVPTP
jgi:hypothetical protein